MNFTINTTMNHVPMCHTCGQVEVAGPFTTADGEGFCSAACEAEVQAEFAAWSAEQDADSAEGRARGQHRDESLVGGKYHGPSNVAGLTAREYGESSRAWEDEQERLRDEW